MVLMWSDGALRGLLVLFLGSRAVRRTCLINCLSVAFTVWAVRSEIIPKLLVGGVSKLLRWLGSARGMRLWFPCAALGAP